MRSGRWSNKHFLKEGIGNTVFSLVKEWIDPRLDLIMDPLRRITKKMLELQMRIEKVSKKNELTEGEEMMLKEAIERVKNNADNGEGTSMWTLVRVG